MAIKTFQPKVSVVLKKNIGRATLAGSLAASLRFRSTSREIDLTPWVGERGAVTVTKSCRQPNGVFSVTFADKMSTADLESLYGLIEPMDVIEIRMAHDTSKYAGKLSYHMPLMMRGIVSDVSRNTAMSENRPDRSVTISGHDYGKFLLVDRIAYLPNEVTGQLLLTQFKLFANYGVGSDPNQDAGAFITDVVNKVVLKFLADMRVTATANGVARGVSPILDIKVDSLVSGGIISPFGANNWPGGTIYDLMSYFGDVGPWNELFVEDREDGVYLVYRPTPFQDASGAYIQDPYRSDHSKAPITTAVPDVDVVGINVSRSDSAVYNYYWVDNPAYQLNNGQVLQQIFSHSEDAKGSIYLENYPNSDPHLYGFRPLMAQTNQGPRIDGKAEADYIKDGNDAFVIVNAKRAVLMANNKDNVVLESGRMRIRGNEAIRAGTYVRVDRGAAGTGLSALHYGHTVTQEFIPFRSYMTTVSFDRGTGYVARGQRGSGAQSPYLSELSTGGVYD